ncbi:hypothetical protein FCULG_00004385 [Fusarium culmorum]|uniref:Uncharacterized protein n=1 Tax=Fusarium culmorum TaxID=5516 RepID=A0A2T4H7N1_FUSCU|nr:hypothetical protein FCULG_00004385 [Fusarium culmorum]
MDRSKASTAGLMHRNLVSITAPALLTRNRLQALPSSLWAVSIASAIDDGAGPRAWMTDISFLDLCFEC